jgi:hypothetical protein
MVVEKAITLTSTNNKCNNSSSIHRGPSMDKMGLLVSLHRFNEVEIKCLF